MWKQNRHQIMLEYVNCMKITTTLEEDGNISTQNGPEMEFWFISNGWKQINESNKYSPNIKCMYILYSMSIYSTQ